MAAMKDLGKQGTAAKSAPTARPLAGKNGEGQGGGGQLTGNYSAGKGTGANGRNAK